MPIAPEEINYTREDVVIREDYAYEKGLRDAIDTIDSELPNCEGSAHLQYAIQKIENQVLKNKIDRLSGEIEKLRGILEGRR